MNARFFINEILYDGLEGISTSVVMSAPKHKTSEEKMRRICQEMKNNSKPRFNQKIEFELWVTHESGTQERIYGV